MRLHYALTLCDYVKLLSMARYDNGSPIGCAVTHAAAATASAIQADHMLLIA